MTKPTRRLSAAFATAAIAGMALLVPSAAHAADLDCASGQIVAPTATGLIVYDLDGRTPLGSLTAPVCAVTGEATAPSVVNTAQPSFEVEFKGKNALVEDFQVAAYPSVSPDQLTEFYAIPTSDVMPENWIGKLGGASSGVFSLPASSGPFADGPLETGMAEGTVYRSSSDLELGTVGQSALAGTVSWQPIEHRGTVAWMASEFLVPLPTADDRFSNFEVDGTGFTLYADPTDTSAKRQVKDGEKFEVTRSVAGWALTSDGDWLRVPSDAQPVDTSGASEAWDKVKDKSKDAWSVTKEKASDLAGAAGDKATETKANSKTLTAPAMIASTVLSALAFIAAIAGLVIRRARGLLALTTPAGISRAALSLVAAPTSLALSMAAVATAPFVWIWPPILAGAATLLSVAALYVYAARIRGGHAHATPDELVAGLRSPLAIAAGVATAAVAIGGAALAGLSWPTYVAAALGAAAIYGGLALTAKRAPEPTAPETADDTRDSETDEAPADAEPARAE